jgi:hypothetical protein
MKSILLILLSVSNSVFGFIPVSLRKDRRFQASVFDDFDAARKFTIVDAMHCSDSGMEAAAEEAALMLAYDIMNTKSKSALKARKSSSEEEYVVAYDDFMDRCTHFERKIVPPTKYTGAEMAAHDAIHRIEDIIDGHDE